MGCARLLQLRMRDTPGVGRALWDGTRGAAKAERLLSRSLESGSCRCAFCPAAGNISPGRRWLQLLARRVPWHSAAYSENTGTIGILLACGPLSGTVWALCEVALMLRGTCQVLTQPSPLPLAASVPCPVYSSKDTTQRRMQIVAGVILLALVAVAALAGSSAQPTSMSAKVCCVRVRSVV